MTWKTAPKKQVKELPAWLLQLMLHDASCDHCHPERSTQKAA